MKNVLTLLLMAILFGCATPERKIPKPPPAQVIQTPQAAEVTLRRIYQVYVKCEPIVLYFFKNGADRKEKSLMHYCQQRLKQATDQYVKMLRYPVWKDSLVQGSPLSQRIDELLAAVDNRMDAFKKKYHYINAMQ